MAAGALRSKVTIRKRTEIEDGAGNHIAGYEDVAGAVNISAQRREMRGKETVTAARLEGRQIYEMKIRFFDAIAHITPAYIMVDHRTGEQYNIRSVQNEHSRDKWMIFTVESGATVVG